ncbi:MAG TPA: hypothetical protein VGL86_22340 [Polyangia bacterium]
MRLDELPLFLPSLRFSFAGSKRIARNHNCGDVWCCLRHLGCC